MKPKTHKELERLLKLLAEHSVELYSCEDFSVALRKASDCLPLRPAQQPSAPVDAIELELLKQQRDEAPILDSLGRIVPDWEGVRRRRGDAS